MGEDLLAVTALHVEGEEPGEHFRGGIHGGDPAVEVECDDAAADGAQDAVGVVLELGQLLEAMAELGLGGVDFRLMVTKLLCHVVERESELADLVAPRRRDPLVELAAGDGLGTSGELPDGEGDAARDEGRAQPADHQGHDGERGELPARPANLRLHAPARQADPGDAPFLSLDVHGHGDVVEGLARLPLGGFLDEQLAAARRVLVHASFEHRAHQFGPPAVGDNRAVPVEDDGVDDVGLTGHLVDVLLERGEVVQQQGASRRRCEASREDLAAALDLVHGGAALASLDHGDEARHDEHEHEQGADEELGLERPDLQGDAAAPPHHRRGGSSHSLRSGKYASPKPFTSTFRTYDWKRRSYV